MSVIRYACLAMCLLAGARGYGQFSGSKSAEWDFNGRLTEGGVSSYEGLVVEIAKLASPDVREHVDVSQDGSFSFRRLEQGEYKVRVLTRYGAELALSIATVGPGSELFELRMPQRNPQKPVTGTISIQELNHPPSKQALKLLASGNKLLEEQRYDDAAARFREAAGIDPESPRVHADLGMALAKMEQWDEAAKEYREAVALDPQNSLLHSNLGAVLASLKRYDEAVGEASKALKLDPQNIWAHYVLAGVLMKKGRPIQEVLGHLVAAADRIPSAKTAVEKICAASRVEGCP